MAVLSLALLQDGVQPVQAADVACSGSPVNQNGWSLSFYYTDDEAMRITNASFNGQSRIFKAHVPVVTVIYPNGTRIYDDMGTWNGTYQNDCQKQNVSGGFVLKSTFIFGGYPYGNCSYKYEQRYYFYSSGAFEHDVQLNGPGCNNLGGYPTYKTFFYDDLDINAASPNYFSKYNGGWSIQTVENNYYNAGYDPYGYRWRNHNSSTYYYSKTSEQYAPDVWALRWASGQQNNPEPAQGEPPLSTWDDNQSINGYDLVNWYIPYASNCLLPETGGTPCTVWAYVTP